MSRRMKLPTREMGEVHLLAIWETDGRWESPWEPLRGTPVGNQFSIISQDALDHALKGWSKPLSDALGIPPSGALRKLPDAARECEKRRTCPFFEPRQCHPGGTNMPWCFEPAGYKDELVRQAVARAIEEWRAGVYLVIVR